MSRKFTKGFVHDSDLNVDKKDLCELTDNLKAGRRPTSLNTPNRKLVSPEAGVRNKKFQLAPPPPAFDSKELAEDMIKVYAGVLKRDTAIPDEELSEFMKMEVNIGAAKLSLKNVTLKTDANAGVDLAEFMQIQNGEVPPKTVTTYEKETIETYGDMASYVHNDKDAHYTIALHAGLAAGGIHEDSTGNDGANSWANFVYFNGPEYCRILSHVLHRSLEFAWQSKYHYMLPRPEVYAWVLDQRPDELPHADLIKNSPEGQAYFAKYGTWLLSQYYSEGSPCHPAYIQGHAGAAIGTVTAIKYILNTKAELVPGKTIQGELDKLAENIALARCWAGVHYHCDFTGGVEAIEQNAVKAIREVVEDYPFQINAHNILGITGKKYVV